MGKATEDAEYYAKSLARKCALVEEQLVGVAERFSCTELQNLKWKNHLSDKAKSLIQERRSAREGGRRSMKDISKDLQKELRA